MGNQVQTAQESIPPFTDIPLPTPPPTYRLFILTDVFIIPAKYLCGIHLSEMHHHASPFLLVTHQHGALLSEIRLSNHPSQQNPSSLLGWAIKALAWSLPRLAPH